MSGTLSKQEKRDQIAQVAQEGLERYIKKHLTTRNQQWQHKQVEGQRVYETNWRDISLYEPGQVQQKTNEILLQAGIYGAELALNPEAGVAMRIRVPEEYFKREVLEALGSGQPLRIHEVRGGGR